MVQKSSKAPFPNTVKFGNKNCHWPLVIRDFLVAAQLFTKANLFIIYKVNWHFGHNKWFTIAKLFLIQPFLKLKFDCSKNGPLKVLFASIINQTNFQKKIDLSQLYRCKYCNLRSCIMHTPYIPSFPGVHFSFPVYLPHLYPFFLNLVCSYPVCLVRHYRTPDPKVSNC